MKIDVLNRNIERCVKMHKNLSKKVKCDNFPINDNIITNGLKNNNFLPQIIKKTIEHKYFDKSLDSNTRCQRYRHVPTNCNLYYIHSESQNKNERDQAYELLYLIVIMKQLWRGKDVKNSINIVYWPIDQPKVFPIKGKVLGVNDVNSAVTYLYKEAKYGDIYIYRQEEAPKIVIHEMIHALGIDYNLFDSNMPVCVTSEMNTNEAFTEVLALYCYYQIHQTKNDTIYHLKKEYHHGLNQSAKILNHYGLKLTDLLESGNRCFPQESGVFSYYIAKTALLPYIDTVLGCIFGRPRNYLIDKKKTEKLVTLALNNKKFIDKLNMKQKLRSNKDVKQKTLRMSLVR